MQYCWSPKEREEEKYLGSVSFGFLTVLSIAFGKGSWEMYVAEKGQGMGLRTDRQKHTKKTGQ